MVIIFSGVPRTGKSTTARGLADQLKKLGKVIILIKEEPSQVYEGFREIYRTHNYQGLLRLLRENLNKADYIIMDATFYNREWREIAKEITGKNNVFTIYLHCSLKTSLERDKQTELPVGAGGICKINKEMEKPEKPDISIDTDKVKPEEAVSQILEKIKEKEVK